jgi:hypothetical protein
MPACDLISSCLIPLTLVLARSVRVARALMRRSLERHEAVGLNPTDPQLQLDLGLTLAALVEAQLPRYAMVANYCGDVAWFKGDRVAARQGYERFLALAPGG